RRARSRASWTSASTVRPATSSARFGPGPIGRARSSPSGRAARRRRRGLAVRPTSYASRSPMRKLSSSPAERRATFLGFQPPAIGEEEVEAVAETLRSGWLTSGPRAAELEERFATYLGARHVVALSSGTAALHLALLALGLPVVEDAAHAAESVYRGRKIGTLSDATCFSLYATKNVAAGEGGLVSTDREDVAEAIRNLRLTRRGDGSVYDVVVPGY